MDMNLQKSSIVALIFGIGSQLLSNWASQRPLMVEQWYSRGVFQGVRWFLDHTTGLLPIPAFYLFWAIVVGYWFQQIRRRPKQLPIFSKIGYWVLKITAFAALLLGLFYWMWGFNYQRQPLAEQLEIQPTPLDTAALWDELRLETRVLDSLRTLLTGTDTMPQQDEIHWPEHAEDTVRAAVEQWLSRYGYPVTGHVRGRTLQPQGILLTMNAAGLYWPFAGEGNIDAGLHPLQKLAVMAHELGHGYGFGDEGVCNFIAYASCCDHTNPYIAYCSHLMYWRTLAPNCYNSDTTRYLTTYRPFIPPGVRQDARAIEAQMDRFEEFFPSLRYSVYDSYLKAQGIEAGLLNYNTVIMLVRAMRQKNSAITK